MWLGSSSEKLGTLTYYAADPHLTLLETQSPEFAKILLAHDVGHVIYGCDIVMLLLDRSLFDILQKSDLLCIFN